MRLLVSVAHPEEVPAALEGGAEIIDAKDPSYGAMGAPDVPVLTGIASALGGRAPFSIALGDAPSRDLLVERIARAAALEASYGKIGFLGIASAEEAARVAADAVFVADAMNVGLGIVLVAYGDGAHVSSIGPDEVLEVAVRVGALGVLLDTARKDAEPLLELVPRETLESWISRAHASGLLVGLAGRLSAAGVTMAAGLGADIAGVRGAACDGGRAGRVRATYVAQLAACCREAAAGKQEAGRLTAPESFVSRGRIASERAG